MTESFIQIAGVVLVMASISYATLILIFFSGWKKLNRNIPGPSRVEPARVTVIVAARNEEKNILTLLGDLAQQDYPADAMEVIVADDMSADLTAKLAKDFIKERNLSNFRLLRREGQGREGSKKAALTLALGAAEGEIILSTDADCRLPKGWVSALVRHFREEGIKLVAGPATFARPETLLDRFQVMEFLGMVASGAGAAGAGMPFLCNGSCMAYRREAFLQVKGYEGNEKYRSGDDVFLMHKIKKEFGSGSVAFALDPEALVQTHAADGFVPFIRQRARWASKSRGYRDFLSIFTAITVFVLSLSLTGLFIGGFFYPASFILFAGLILCKTAVDSPLMNEILRFTGNKDLIKWLLPFEAIYPFYVVIAGIISLFWRRLW